MSETKAIPTTRHFTRGEQKALKDQAKRGEARVAAALKAVEQARSEIAQEQAELVSEIVEGMIELEPFLSKVEGMGLSRDRFNVPTGIVYQEPAKAPAPPAKDAAPSPAADAPKLEVLPPLPLAEQKSAAPAGPST